MIAKTYGIYDSIQCEYVRTFTASNDSDAKRAASQIVRTPNFDDISYNDRSIHHLYDVDTSTGKIVNNDIYQVFNFSTAITERKQQELEKTVQEKLLTDEFKQEVKDMILLSVKGEIHNEQNNS